VILDPDEMKVDRQVRGPDERRGGEYLAFLKKGAGSGAGGQGPGAGDSGGLPRVTSLTGQSVETATLQGKVVVVNFWAHLVRALHSGDPQLQQAAQGTGAEGAGGAGYLDG